MPFEQDERIAAVITTKEFGADENLLFATAEGMVKKTSLSAYARVLSTGIIAIKLRQDDEIVAVRRVKPAEKVMLVSTDGKAILFEESEARPMGRDTTGVRGMAVKGDARVLGMEIAPENAELFVVTQRGYGKRTPVSDYPIHHRGGLFIY